MHFITVTRMFLQSWLVLARTQTHWESDASQLTMLQTKLTQKKIPNEGEGSEVADYVIVGAGTSGSLLAERLSRLGSVIVLECGSSVPSSVSNRLPGATCTFNLLVDKQDFNTSCGTPCQKALTSPHEGSYGLDYRRGLGGTSAVAVGTHFRGGQAFWKELAAEHGRHWAHSKKTFRRLEKEMSVRWAPAAVDRDHVLFSDAVAGHLGSKKAALLESKRQIGTASFIFPRYQDASGWATNSYSQYLQKALMRPGVKLIKNACAKHLVLNEDKAAPMVVVDKTQQIKARREVIVAAGALGSPALLQRSGLPTTPLRDQPAIVVAWPCSNCRYIAEFLQQLPSLFGGEAISKKPPPALTMSGFDSGIFVELAGHPALLFASTEYLSSTSPLYKTIKPPDDGYTVLAVHIALLQPRMYESNVTSDGSMQSVPQLQHPEDLAAGVEGIRLVREILGNESSAAKKLQLGAEVLPGANLQSDDQLKNFLMSKDHIVSLQSATASCRLGEVVDGDLRVKGTHGLRVADASVLPRPPLGRTLFPTLLVGEVAAKLIKNTSH